MAKKIKIKSNTTPEDILTLLDELKRINQNEFDLVDLKKIAFRFDCEEAPTTGSQVRFKHKYCSHYGGYFGVHTTHTGKTDRKVKKADYVRYFYPPMKEIIEKTINEK